MKVKEISTQFITESTNIYGLVIECNPTIGFDDEIDNIVERAKHFAHVIIKGDDPFIQKDDIVRFVKKLLKENNTVKIILYTTGKIRPPSILENTQYWVNVQLKNSGVDYEKRIMPLVIEWYVQLNANFIFYINHIDDADEADMLIKDLGIPKGAVYFGCNNYEQYNETMVDIRTYCKTKGYNCLVDVNRM